MSKTEQDNSIYICSLLKPVDQLWFRLIDSEKQEEPSLSHFEEKKLNEVEPKLNKCLHKKFEIKKKNSEKKWKKEEVNLLIKLNRSNIKKKWKKISKILGKSIMQCIYKYKCLLKRNRIKNSNKDPEDVLLTDKKVKEFFTQNFNLNFVRVSEIKTNIAPSDDFLPKHDILPLKPLIKLARLEYINSTIIKQNTKDSNSILNYNKKEKEMRTSTNRRETSKVFFDEVMRKNSPDELLPNNLNPQINLDPFEFQKGFDMNFTQASTDEKEDFMINESDFKIDQNFLETPGLTLHFRDKSEATLRQIENFLNSREFLNPRVEEINDSIYKMTKFLTDLSKISSGSHSHRDLMVKALELQTLILSSMIRFTQLKMMCVSG